jgi:hypothetical protein
VIAFWVLEWLICETGAKIDLTLVFSLYSPERLRIWNDFARWAHLGQLLDARAMRTRQEYLPVFLPYKRDCQPVPMVPVVDGPAGFIPDLHSSVSFKRGQFAGCRLPFVADIYHFHWMRV